MPIGHASRFAAAAKAADVDLQFKVHPFEGHGWSDPADEADFYQRVEVFPAAHLAPRRAAR